MGLLDFSPDHPFVMSPEQGLTECELGGGVAKRRIPKDRKDGRSIAHLVPLSGALLGLDASKERLGHVEDPIRRIPGPREGEELERALTVFPGLVVPTVIAEMPRDLGRRAAVPGKQQERISRGAHARPSQSLGPRQEARLQIGKVCVYSMQAKHCIEIVLRR